MTKPDIESLIAAARERHWSIYGAVCSGCGRDWPCPDHLLHRALVSERETLRTLLRDAIETVHQTDSTRSHADPNDKTGWNVHGIETCTDLLCVEALAALGEPNA